MDKRNAKKVWGTIREDASKSVYKTARKQAKSEVAKVRNKAYKKLRKIRHKAGGNELFKIAKQRNRQSKDV